MIRHLVDASARLGKVALPGLPERVDVAASFRYCEALTRAHHENFPVASRFLPAPLRPHVLALYAFARTANDLADQPESASRCEEALDRWEEQLRRCWHGEAEHPIFVALAATAHQFELPITPLADLLAGFRMDLRVARYATWQDLLAYTALSAKPVGRLLLYVFGHRDADRHRYAEDLSTALALTGVWQDLARDLGRDRVYVPQEDLRHFGVTETDLFARKRTRGLAALVRFECARTRALFERSRPLVDLVSRDLAVEIALVWHGGMRALAKVQARADREPFAARAPLSILDKARVLAQAMASAGPFVGGRAR